jgi:hypothetical protein
MTIKSAPRKGTKSNVTGTGASVTVLAANPRRKHYMLFNDSGVAADIDLSGGTATSTSCSLNMPDQSVWEPYPNTQGCYTGAITGIWASGSIRVTEFE